MVLGTLDGRILDVTNVVRVVRVVRVVSIVLVVPFMLFVDVNLDCCLAHLMVQRIEIDDGAVLGLPLRKPEGTKVELPFGADDGPNDGEVIGNDDGEISKTATCYI